MIAKMRPTKMRPTKMIAPTLFGLTTQHKLILGQVRFLVLTRNRHRGMMNSFD